MKIGVVPTKYGYSAVALPPYDGDWRVSSSVKIPHDLFIQLRGQILNRLAEYCHDLSGWTGQLPVAIPWAIMGILAIALCSLWKLGFKYIGLYMWVRFFFFFDGVWLLTKYITHWRGLRDAKQIREKIVRGQWVFVNTDMPKQFIDHADLTITEREYISEMMHRYPQTMPYYKEMLRVEEPWLFSAAPLGATGLIRFLLCGVRVPRPTLVFELGELK